MPVEIAAMACTATHKQTAHTPPLPSPTAPKNQGTTSLAFWMTHHPALRWVSKVTMLGEAGEEAHVLDAPSAAIFDEMIERSLLPHGKGKFAATAPEAVEADRVIDCESIVRSRVRARVLETRTEEQDGAGGARRQTWPSVWRAFSRDVKVRTRSFCETPATFGSTALAE